MWDYSIVYVEIEKEFIVAEVYYENENDNSNPVSYCEADVTSDNKKDLIGILKRLLWQLENDFYYIHRDGKLFPYKGGNS